MSSTFVNERRETLLRIESVGLSYNKGEVVVLRNVNAEVRNITRPDTTQGQVVAILGPSGVGKTSLFRIVAGLQGPTEGRVLVGPEGVPVVRGQVGVVDQNYRLFMHRTVFDNLAIAGDQGGLSYVASREKAEALLARFGLADRKDYFPIQLSGGQKQRVSIARQLMSDKSLLLMDEPFSGLDLVAIDNVINLIHEVANLKETNTIILVTHDVTSALKCADTVWMMGRDVDAAGQFIPGAYIKEVIDLVERDLCWHPDIAERPDFISLGLEVKRKFKAL